MCTSPLLSPEPSLAVACTIPCPCKCPPLICAAPCHAARHAYRHGMPARAFVTLCAAQLPCQRLQVQSASMRMGWGGVYNTGERGRIRARVLQAVPHVRAPVCAHRLGVLGSDEKGVNSSQVFVSEGRFPGISPPLPPVPPAPTACYSVAFFVACACTHHRACRGGGVSGPCRTC